jgi:hypothetical protein
MEHDIGVVQRRRTRSTGTTVEVLDLRTYPTPPSDEADGGRWLTICDEHGGNVQHETRALAISWASDPATWCDGCQS